MQRLGRDNLKRNPTLPRRLLGKLAFIEARTLLLFCKLKLGFLCPISSIEASFVKGWLECDTSCNAWFSYKWGQFNCVRMFWCHILRIIPLTCLKPKFFFANFKFEFYNLIRLSYLIYCCQRTKSWTSSLRKSVLILTRSDFEEVNVVTCWDKKKCDSYHLTVASKCGPSETKTSDCRYLQNVT